MAESEPRAPRWNDLFWWLYDLTPPATDKLRTYCGPAVALARNLRVPLLLLRGRSLVGSETAVLAVGDLRWSAAEARRFFRDEPTHQPLKPVPVYRLNKLLSEWAQRVELVVAHVSRIAARMFDSDYLTVPGSLSLMMTVPDSLAELNRLNKDVKEDVRRIRASGFSFEVTRDFKDFDQFYYRYYVPLMQVRHGLNAVVHNRHLLRRSINRGGILWITEEGRRVAACGFQQQPNFIDMVAVGIEDGRLDIMRRGALPATYYFLSSYAIEQCCKHIELGSTASYLTNGLLQYKRKWRPQIAMSDSASSVHMHWPRLSEAVVEFLAKSSIIFVEDNKLSALTAIRSHEPASPEQADKLLSQQAVPGLHRFWVVSPSGWQSTVTTKTIDRTELKMVQTFHPHDIKKK